LIAIGSVGGGAILALTGHFLTEKLEDDDIRATIIGI